MSNELANLTCFSRNLFKHGFMFLVWYMKNLPAYSCDIDNARSSLRYVEALTKDKPFFFGKDAPLKDANKALNDFYTAIKPYAASDKNTQALEHFNQAWKHAWTNREVFQLRGHEIRMMKFFHEIICNANDTHLPELLSMARLIDNDTVKIARSICMPAERTPAKQLPKLTKQVIALRKQLFDTKNMTPAECKKAQEKNPKIYQEYSDTFKEYKRVAHLRIIEIFDAENWFQCVDSEILHGRLQAEKLDEFLPITFTGRLGVQPTGYPLTFYTYAGLELEKPPLNEVEMNPDYGIEETDKNYKIHPINDGTYYCQSSAVMGDSKLKYYTLEYKRRARELKYAQVDKLAQSIDAIRKRLRAHLRSKHRNTWVRALMCLFIDKKYARIGNQISAKAKTKTYGVTTLLTKKHVKVKAGKITISYKGKHDQPQKHTFKIYTNSTKRKKNSLEALIADRLIELINENNEHLFTRDDQKPFTAQQVNDYFRAPEKVNPASEKDLPLGGAASPCTVHCMRNLHATRIFAEFSQDFAKNNLDPAYKQILDAYQGRAETKTQPGITGILDIIAKALGNTPAICRKSYVDPKEQLLYFKQFGYRPPESLTRDVFDEEESDTYGLDNIAKKKQKQITRYTKQRQQTAKTRKKVLVIAPD